MVADLLEVLHRALVARNARPPEQRGQRRRAKIAIERARFRHIGEAQTFGCEAHIGAPCIVERPAIGADAIIVCDARIRMKGQGAARRRIDDVGDIGSIFVAKARQDFLEERRPPV